MNKQIAILTLYYKNYNYGGVLQAFALQRTIFLLGYKSVQISYNLETGYCRWNSAKKFIKSPLAYMFHRLMYGRWFNYYLKRHKIIEQFACKIPHTKVVTASTIRGIVELYDCFICGSDQIWNPIGWQTTLFLDFVPKEKNKIAYAASIARDNLTKEELEFIRKYIDDFSAISVREKNSADLLNNKYPELHVQYMPDPVFLLKESEWENIIQRRKNSEKFIFAYFLGDENSNREKALKYAEEIGIKIVFAAYLGYFQFDWDKEHPNQLSNVMGVEDFLDNIANASLVLTDSFHAAAFSIILRTPFYVMPRFNEGDSESMNSRICTLMEDFDLQDRYTNTLRPIYEWSSKELNNISDNLKRLREKGINFLKNSI